MSGPITFTANAIATLAFQKMVEGAGSATGKKFSENSLEIIDQLRQTIVSRYKGQENVKPILEKAERGDSASIQKLAKYLDEEMLDEAFREKLFSLAEEISVDEQTTEDQKNYSYISQNSMNESDSNFAEKSLPELSASVQLIAKKLNNSNISSFDIAEEIKRIHGEYGSNRLRTANLIGSLDVQMREWSIWLDSVVNLYSENALQQSRHKVISGRLLLVGLALLDNPLKIALENDDVWGALLLEIDEALVQENDSLRKALNTIQLAHGYQSDRPEGDDKLGIQGEVNALCEVILDSKVTPPLAVGLFGAWGSGKSFFMEKMRLKVDQLTSGEVDDRPTNVVQIRFNAWHYSDTSLWASLAVEIFERLADPEPIDFQDREIWLQDKGNSKKNERETLLKHLETYQAAKVPLEREIERLKREKKVKEGEQKEAKKERDGGVALLFSNLAKQNLMDALSKDENYQENLKEIKSKLKQNYELNGLKTLRHELNTSWGYLSQIWSNIKNKETTFILLLIALILLIIPAVMQLFNNGSLQSSLFSVGGSVLTTMIAINKQILPSIKAVNNAVEFVYSALERATKIEENLVEQHRISEEFKLAELNNQIAARSSVITNIDEKIATIEAKAEALTVGRSLYNFLSDRAAGYQSHQGVVGMLHRDFRLLDALFRAQRSTSNSSELPRIDRVILYIDDLDRCSPAKVLEVLEAVHLLLALELFIVVVGVDPRWLQRSLRHQYRNLSLSKDIDRDPYLQHMPTEYLEKIFQIPLTLPVMETTAYKDLILSLAPDTKMPSVPQELNNINEYKFENETSDKKIGKRKPTRSLLNVQPGSAADKGGGRSIDLTSDEVSFAQQLGGLVDTPRAAKRLINTYRLIRATQHVGSRSRFLGSDGEPGEFYAVLTLLSIAAGYPRFVDQVLVELEEHTNSNKKIGWDSFLEKINSLQEERIPRNLHLNEASNVNSLADANEWEKMFSGLVASLSSNKLNKLETYQKWGKTVARFSFTI